jgi:hypothetical protein
VLARVVATIGGDAMQGSEPIGAVRRTLESAAAVAVTGTALPTLLIWAAGRAT